MGAEVHQCIEAELVHAAPSCASLRHTFNVYSPMSATARTNIVLNPRLVNRVKKLAGAKTARQAIHVALEHYARSRDYSAVIALHGSSGVAKGYDPKTAAPARR